MGRSGPGAGVSLSAIANSKRYAVVGRRDWKARYRTLLVHVALLCPTLVRLFSAVPGTERSSRDYQCSLSICHSTDNVALDGGRNSLCRAERSTEDGTFDRGRGRSSQDGTLYGARSV